MLFLIMQYCDKGDLGHHIKQQMNVPFLEKKIWKFFIQMLLGIEYLHNKNVLHRDISTKNIFLTRDYQIRIGDFGVI
jgi:serine/threonine protein kinase